MSVSSTMQHLSHAWQRRTRLPTPDAMQLSVQAENSLYRRWLEAYIRDGFAEHYQASLKHFMPLLVALSSESEWRAALGVRAAESGPLFSERYLSTPIEQQLSDGVVSRQRIAEIGNLYASCRGASRLLFVVVGNALLNLGREWLVFTGTPQVQRSMQKIGIELTPLGQAEREALGRDAGDWGSYYQRRPQVLSCHLPTARARANHHAVSRWLLQLTAPMQHTLQHSLQQHQWPHISGVSR